MSQSNGKKVCVVLMSAFVWLSTTMQATAQSCVYGAAPHTWGESTGSPPAIVAAGDHLILAWAGGGGGGLNTAVSWDSYNWYYKTTHPSWPQPVQGVSGGVQMTYSVPCNATYVSWRDSGFNLWAAKSADGGVSWAGPYSLGQGETAPALRGDDPSLGIGFAVSQPVGGTHRVYKGKFDCNFGNYVYPIQPCFFDCNGPENQYEPYPVAWTGASGVALNALSTGPPLHSTEQILYTHWNTPWSLPAGEWSNNGVAGTMNPADGTGWIAFTCHQSEGDSCNPQVQHSTIKIFNVEWQGKVACDDFSLVNPAITYWQGMLWIAWTHAYFDNYLRVASVYPF